MANCNHSFIYGGVKYKIAHQLAGSNARAVRYYDWFYCNKCLENLYKELSERSNTTQQIRFNATPKE